MNKRRVGKVKFWLESSGYGFLYPPENEPSADDAFVHASELRKSGIATPLKPGQTLGDFVLKRFAADEVVVEFDVLVTAASLFRRWR
jgi:cold shock CspA family protein